MLASQSLVRVKRNREDRLNLAVTLKDKPSVRNGWTEISKYKDIFKILWRRMDGGNTQDPGKVFKDGLQYIKYFFPNKNLNADFEVTVNANGRIEFNLTNLNGMRFDDFLRILGAYMDRSKYYDFRFGEFIFQSWKSPFERIPATFTPTKRDRDGQPIETTSHQRPVHSLGAKKDDYNGVEIGKKYTDIVREFNKYKNSISRNDSYVANQIKQVMETGEFPDEFTNEMKSSTALFLSIIHVAEEHRTRATSYAVKEVIDKIATGTDPSDTFTKYFTSDDGFSFALSSKNTKLVGGSKIWRNDFDLFPSMTLPDIKDLPTLRPTSLFPTPPSSRPVTPANILPTPDDGSSPQSPSGQLPTPPDSRPQTPAVSLPTPPNSRPQTPFIPPNTSGVATPLTLNHFQEIPFKVGDNEYLGFTDQNGNFQYRQNKKVGGVLPSPTVAAVGSNERRAYLSHIFSENVKKNWPMELSWN